jgi:GNAT superfamily N-acetyltransferase
MNEVVTDQYIDSGNFPIQFKQGWLNFFEDETSADRVLCLYLNENNEPGDLKELGMLEDLPDAYVSWDRNGICVEIFVKLELRRAGIGTALCAYARTHALKSGIIFSAPHKMSLNAKMMYESICDQYGEPYSYPEQLGDTLAYGYWGARFMD